MNKASGKSILAACCVLSALIASQIAIAAEKSPEPLVRELFVPFEDLNVVLDAHVERVFVTREQYEELLAKSQAAKVSKPKHDAAIISADYTAVVEGRRVRIAGKLVVDSPDDEIRAVPLPINGVSLRSATLGGHSATIARSGPLTLFVSKAGRQELLVEMLAPLETAVAQQSFQWEAPAPPASKLLLTVPGYVELKSGAKVLRRTVDEDAQVTRFELLSTGASTAIVLTLNNRQLQKQRVVVARSVLVDELTEAYERLHATVSLAMLHGATDQFRFNLPEGFEVTSVASPLLARWNVKAGTPRVLEVTLRESTTETVVLNISAVRTPARLQDWSFPKLEPLEIAGQVAIVGLLVENRLKPQVLTSSGLLSIDTSVLVSALPESLLRSEPGSPQVRPISAYYAPQGAYALSGNFEKPPVEIRARATLLLSLGDKAQKILGTLTLIGTSEKLFAVDFLAPADWQITEVTTAEGQALPFEREDADAQRARIHIRLPQAAPAGTPVTISFQAIRTPAGWLEDWTKQEVAFPGFAVVGATHEMGTVAVQTHDDLSVRPDKLTALVPLDENKKAEFGLAGVTTSLAYQYQAPPYAATLIVERTPARITARTYSFLRIAPEQLVAHYEIAYDIVAARTNRLAFTLPASTPAELYVRGLDGVVIKEFTSDAADGVRRWNVLLAEPKQGIVRLAVDFQDRLPETANGQKATEQSLPLIAAADVIFQSGLAAVEGSAELDVQVATTSRKVDVGELAEAEYQPGRRLLGAFGFAGDQAEIKVTIRRQPGYGLPAAVVERNELVTLVAANRQSQTAARFLMRTKALLVEVQLPENSQLWSAYLDGQPTLPQREQDRLLISLPAQPETHLRDLQLVYETPISSWALTGKVDVAAPKLFLRATGNAPAVEVPVADLAWHLRLPSGYRIVRTGGTVFTKEIPPRRYGLFRRSSSFGLTSGSYEYDIDFTGGFAASAPAAGEALPAPEVSAADSPMTAGKSFKGDSILEDREQKDEASKKLPEAKPAEEPAATPSPAMPSVAPLPPQSPPTASGPMPADPFGAPATARPTPLSITAPTNAAQPAKARQGYWALEGVRSLKVDLVADGDQVTFASLGSDPELQVTVVHEDRLGWLATGLALVVLLYGLTLTRRPALVKLRYLLGIFAITTLVPLVTPWYDTLADVLNPAYWMMWLLLFYYVISAPVVWLWRQVRRVRSRLQPAPVAAATLLLAALLTTAASAEEPNLEALLKSLPPVHVPPGAVIIPYDPKVDDGLAKAEKVFVPYDKYVELWNTAYPDKRLTTKAPPAPFGLSGASFSGVLGEGDDLLLSGHIDIDVFTDQPVAVPLPLKAGVLAQATLSGQPATLQVIEAAPPAAAANAPNAPGPMQQPVPQQAAKVAKPVPPPAPQPLLVLHLTGRGRQRLELAVRYHVDKRGGWRVAGGRLPTAPATALSLQVPKAETEVQFTGAAERGVYETKQDNETLESAPALDGAFQVQWRAKAAQSQVEQGLTAQSEAALDVQEDGLRLIWQLSLQFRRNQRDSFTVEVPGEYLIEKVTGDNVRGWQAKTVGNRQQLDVTLLKTATDKAEFAIQLARRVAVGQADFTRLSVPNILVPEAMLQQGRVFIRRSPLLELRTPNTDGVTRVDDTAQSFPADNQESPLGLRPYQGYRFITAPFTIELTVSPVQAALVAEVQNVLKIAEREDKFESRINLRATGRPVYRLEFELPKGLKLDRVVAPEPFEWTTTANPNGDKLTIDLATGQEGAFAVVLTGAIAQAQIAQPHPLPRLSVVGAQRQEGDTAIQADPTWEVRAEELVDAEVIPTGRVQPWLNPTQQQLARLAIHHRTAQYAGLIRLTARKPIVSGFTVSNVKVTERAFEETIFIELAIRDAGIREVSFLMPASMRDSQITAPLLRQKTVSEVEGNGSQVRVRLELQDEVMGPLRVLVQNDRLLTTEKYTAPVPQLENYQTDRRYVTLESAGRDEVVVDQHDGLELLSPQQSEWRMLADLLNRGLTQAYLVSEGAEPLLVFHTQDREAVETAGARIELAKTTLTLDMSGAYRAEQLYKIDNSIEQFLVIQMPPGAELWTVYVAGEPVKPTTVPGAKAAGQVRIPLVKTAAGDLDFPVVLKYGGRLSSLGTLGSVDFPLIRTLNINVELSQVKLHLPEDYYWTNFGGTMRRVLDQRDLEAGFLSYNTRQLEKLKSALSSKSEYAKVRALSNLKQLSDVGSGYEYGMPSSSSRNEQLEQERNTNSRLQMQVQEQAAQQAAQSVDALETDNRRRLNDLVQGQQLKRSRNVVNDVGGNFDGPVPVNPADQAPQPEGRSMARRVVGAPQSGEPAPGRFNNKWFDSNKLRQDQLDDATAAKKAGEMNQRPLGQPGKSDESGGFRFGNKSNVAAQPAAPQVVQGKTKLAQDALGDKQVSSERSVPQSKVQAYQNRLEQQAANAPPPGPSAANAAPGANAPSPAKPAPQADGDRPTSRDERDLFQAEVRGAQVEQDQLFVVDGTTSMHRGGEQGLASLDVALPVRGYEYSFTTPRGEVKITASAVSTSVLARLGKMLVVAVILVALALLYRRLEARWDAK